MGLVVPAGSGLHVRKVPAYFSARSGPITVELAEPLPGEALAWVPAATWTGAGRPDMRPWMTTRVTFDGCPNRDTAYFGGILATRPDACLHLSIRHAGPL